jgi:hypothetical protein
MNIKPIETVYNGYRFRSRLEARWAVFFDAAGIEYQYEPEGFDLGDGLYYLPDFYLPKDDVWIEIKGKAPTAQELEKIGRFCLGKCDITKDGTRFRMLVGDIPDNLLGLPNYNKPIGLPCIIYNSPSECEKFQIDCPFPYGILVHGIWVPGCSIETAQLALIEARQARFEHGETPNVRSVTV